ncbi:glucose-6-phosphate isomerase [Acidocella aminolytica]|jgi:glucose-6-phosphate isomerase|uniref:Glucose-6-phosphate isomerase n=1 Tax=Acidocella aminolytica 101 = DSM 11237 TaxID=1120923 RepID=A0A0D6PJQ6_9PROT|nr:glucose-6-phosphate isomerase [Acidocella aminolytica]GAN81912.1 glucose-6-phosphate isomerase [Acidocella aminolytica 101 = DSM 11237]GBQ42655.1 glucose-6-phosphate isomerase [Acidocella aminolytica 101 = DSM 11237]SHF21052.1 glucose-6-phosphate isomerase [Acidocella aminolytica 101 = DSM 11237]
MSQTDWTDVKNLAASAPDIRSLFTADADRFTRFSAHGAGILLDYSKTSLTDESLAALLRLAREAGVETKRDAMFTGEIINITEQRAVLHTALRAPANASILVAGRNVVPDVWETLDRFLTFAEAVRGGSIAASDGKAFTDVVNIGIGGSDLGPAMVTGALAPYHDGPHLHFVSNVDSAHLADTLRELDPARTLFIVASKTFTTVETMTNAGSARHWLAKALGEDAVGAHFCAVSTALDKCAAFGIAPDRIFGFWDWVGGRYSVWSSVGLPVAIAIGATNFRAFLAGAREMDEHFRTAPLEQNLPVLLALVGVWHRDGLGYPARAILPYDQRLSRFAAYLQQLDMESNGKRVTREGEPVAHATGPLVFGEPGTNGQHAFYQLIHQGTDVIPCEFYIAAQGHEPELAAHHDLLIANCLAQMQALLLGRTLSEAGGNPHRVFPGNRPSLVTAYEKLDPATMGKLIALYEHRVFTEAALWNINAFDQWGVELGKELATRLLPVVEGKQKAAADSSTAGLVSFLRGSGAAPQPV